MRACSDDQLLNEDSGWGAYLEGRQRHGARGAAIPRSADPADLPSSYAESMTSPTQPSPQARLYSSFAHQHISHRRQITCWCCLCVYHFQSRQDWTCDHVLHVLPTLHDAIVKCLLH